ncbi:hypothetical protein, partial [Streptomyces rochei]|uniref:hypothetical protein n=1 Tax=Streptomyces rochei TaxID=1928 RepID=UPI0022E99F28
PPIKVQVFYQAREVRRKRAAADISVVEKTIPIFEALVESDPERKYHRNLGQLGYALMGQRSPNYSAAGEALTLAIQARGDARTQGFSVYEFCRAICKIMSDTPFRSGQPSDEETRKLILNDLKVARTEDKTLRDEHVDKWMALNR